MSRKASPREHLSTRIEINPKTHCWEYTGHKNKAGTGMVFYGGRNYTAPRFAYEAFIGPVPLGKHPLLKCRTLHCANPEHVILSNSTSLARKPRRRKPAKRKSATDRCRNGHLFIRSNVKLGKNGYRICLQCKGENNARQRQRQQSAPSSEAKRPIGRPKLNIVGGLCNKAAHPLGVEGEDYYIYTNPTSGYSNVVCRHCEIIKNGGGSAGEKPEGPTLTPPDDNGVVDPSILRRSYDGGPIKEAQPEQPSNRFQERRKRLQRISA